MAVLRVAAAIAMVLASGCLRTTAFRCESSAECTGTGGTCESVGYCSFTDSNCESGRRYGDLSGPYASRCVGDEPDLDGGVDGKPADGMIDALVGCPPDYQTIGVGTHVYGKLAAAEWDVQRTNCAAGNGNLVIPDDATELTAVMAFAGADIWVGITDSASEGTYVTVLGAPATFLPWQSGQPDNGPGNADCVSSRTTGTYLDDRCNVTRPAVCECVPP